MTIKRVLNIVGNNKKILIPGHYDDWEHYILDVSYEADYKYNILDVVHQNKSWPYRWDAVYTSHFLEHFHSFQLFPIVKYINSIIKVDGWIEIKVPDFRETVKRYLTRDNVFDTLYTTIHGEDINTLDVVMGHQKAIKDYNPYQMHKMTFDNPTLKNLLHVCGFASVKDLSNADNLELHMIGWKDADS